MEICDFYNYMSPTQEEETMRQNVVDRISGLITSIWPSAKVCVSKQFNPGSAITVLDWLFERRV